MFTCWRLVSMMLMVCDFQGSGITPRIYERLILWETCAISSHRPVTVLPARTMTNPRSNSSACAPSPVIDLHDAADGEPRPDETIACVELDIAYRPCQRQIVRGDAQVICAYFCCVLRLTRRNPATTTQRIPATIKRPLTIGASIPLYV